MTKNEKLIGKLLIACFVVFTLSMVVMAIQIPNDLRYNIISKVTAMREDEIQELNDKVDEVKEELKYAVRTGIFSKLDTKH